MTTTMVAVYAEGWQDAAVGPMTRAAAQRRDADGAPYVVLLVDGGRLHAMLRLSWRDRHCEVVRFDALGRTVAEHVLRSEDGRELFLLDSRTWSGPDDLTPEEFARVAARHHVRYSLDGRQRHVTEPNGEKGGSRHTQRSGPAPRLPVPPFGGWAALLDLAGAGEVTLVDATDQVLPTAGPGGQAWEPPVPLRPERPDLLFVAGTERRVDDRVLRIEVHEAGNLHLPSGRVIAADPTSLEFDAAPYTVTVPPGEWPVTISLARFVDEPEHARVAAARLAVSSRPVHAWEPALLDGQRLVELGRREFYGFGVDAAMGAFVDAVSAPRLVEAWTSFDGPDESGFMVVEGGAMIVWTSGWGDGAYPVWIGRDAGGDVVCFVADMLLFAPGP